MKQSCLLLLCCTPLAALAQTAVYGSLDAAVVGEGGCQLACPQTRLNGLRAGAIYSLGESPYNSAINRAYGLTIGYARGAANLSVSYQRKDNLIDGNGPAPLADQSGRNVLVAANLNFGVFTGYAALGRSKGEGSSPWDMSNPYGVALAQNTPASDSRDALVGIAVPRGPFAFLASFVRKNDLSPLHRDAHQIAVGMTYTFSPRTDLYMSLARIQNSNGAANPVGNASEAGHGERAVHIGIHHAF